MNKAQIEMYLISLTDKELKERLKYSVIDLQSTAKDQRYSDWHESCFAGCMMYVREANRRGIKND